MASMANLPQTWNMDAMFPGGSHSPEFAEFLVELERDIVRFAESLRTVQGEPPEERALESLVERLQSIGVRLKESEAFAGCLAAQNDKDKKAVALGAGIRSLIAFFESELVRFDQMLANVRDEEWKRLMELPSFAPVAFPLSERRAQALLKMSPEQEALVNDLAVDGYHGWSELYDTAVGAMAFPYEENGETVPLSAGQAYNKLHHPRRDVRQKMSDVWEDTWSKHADYCASALNHLGGFRLQVYKHRGWNSIHQEPLALNRMSEETLQSMWHAVEENRTFLLDYFRKKAERLGVERLSWHDVDAPIGSANSYLSYDEGAALILEQFRQFSPKLAAFSERAFRERWIEAENRPGKRPGGFCTSFPIKKQTRIFMTYEGTMNNVSTLAHELGHAYHQYVMDDMPPLSQNYAMNVAETASTFAEMILSDAAIRNAADRNAKLALLDDKIQRAAAFLMNIHARFLFETAFYEERKQGVVSVERLNELMTDAQRAAYHDALASWHPHFWASKLHFYITEVPFYNFPYTFGYLFSAGIYRQAQEEGPGFEDRYVRLLRDTGSMSVEALARKHLGVDVTTPEFWRSAVDPIRKDVEEFISL